MTHIRRVQPVSVDETFVYYQPMLLKGAPDEINEARLREHEFGFGPAGFISPDDIEIMERNQRGVERARQRVAVHRPRRASRHDRCRTAVRPASRWTRTRSAACGSTTGG